jgi:hypothetical protein
MHMSDDDERFGEDKAFEGDYRQLFDNTYVRAWDLPQGRDLILTIARVEGGEIGKPGEKSRRPIIFFRTGKKGLVLNKGMGKAMKGMYGRFAKDWIGKPIALYATTENAFGETHDVVRIRPKVPVRPSGKKPESERKQLPAGPQVHDGEFEEAHDGQEVA